MALRGGAGKGVPRGFRAALLKMKRGPANFAPTRRRGRAARIKEDFVLSVETLAAKTADLTALRPGASPVTPAAMLAVVLASLEDDKAEDVVQIALRGKSTMADHMIVASGRSTRQVAAISQNLFDAIKREFGLSCKIEGKDAGDWVLVDAGDVIVHVFRPEVREFYQLEKMWMSPAEAAKP